MPKVLSPRTDNGEYNVRAFGAKGDGTTNDAAAINAALQKCFDDGGGTVRIPAGEYSLGSHLVCRQDTTVICDNNVRIFRTASGPLIMNGEFDEDQSVYTGHGNIRIIGGVWDMRGPTVTNSNIALAFAHGNNISIEGVTVKDVPQNHAIEINSSKTVRIRDCKFLGYKANDGGTVDYNEAVQIDLALTGGGTFGAFGLYDDTPCDDVVVTGCYFGASGTAGTTAWYRGVGSHSGKIGFEHTNVRITDNHFDGLLGVAVGLYGYRRTVVADNSFDGCGAAVYANSATDQDIGNISITGNVIKDCTGALAAITIGPSTGDAEGIVVSGNAIDGTTGTSGHGIDMSRSTYVNVTANTIANVGGAGIRFVGTCNDVSVTNNIISTTGDAGIQVTNSLNCIVSGNTIRNAGANGIYSTSSTDVSYQNNYVKGAGRNTNATYYGFRLSTGCSGYRISGNRIRKFGSGNEVLLGISVANTCSGGYVKDNDIQDTGIDDDGTSRATSELTAAGAAVATAQATSSTSYGDLTTAGPAVTVNTGTSAIVILSAAIDNTNEKAWAAMSCAVSGASTIAAADANAFAHRQLEHSGTITAAGQEIVQASFAYVENGLTPGSNTFTAKYRAITAGTATFQRRAITVIPI